LLFVNSNHATDSSDFGAHKRLKTKNMKLQPNINMAVRYWSWEQALQPM